MHIDPAGLHAWNTVGFECNYCADSDSDYGESWDYAQHTGGNPAWRGGGRASDWSVCASCSNRHGTDRAELQPVYENGRTAVRSYHMGMYIFCCLPDTEAYGRKGVLQRGRSSFGRFPGDAGDQTGYLGIRNHDACHAGLRSSG